MHTEEIITELIFDTEATIFQKGNPFAKRNRLCYIGYGVDGDYHCLDVRKLENPPASVAERLDAVDCVVGFNIKYDLHWGQRYGLHRPKRVWDCQTAHFLLTHQKKPYPSLNEVAAHYGLEGKFDYIAENYWSKGIDTPDIPAEEMMSYNIQDLKVTEAVYRKQKAEFEKLPKLYRLFVAEMADLLVLQEMEYNGVKLNVEKCEQEKERVKTRIGDIEKTLQLRCPNTPINWDSGDDLSAYLYGGSVVRQRKEPAGFFKTGAKIGQVRYKLIQDTYPLGRLVDPIEGSELKKGNSENGPWSTAEDVLKQVKQVEEVKLLLERAKLSKLLDYVEGFPDLIKEKDWEDGKLHGQFNQTVARTGRLSSSDPNLQNLPDQILRLIETRYALS